MPRLLAATREDRPDRRESDEEVKPKALVPDVEEVVLELLQRVADRSAVSVVDLCPAREPGADAMASAIELDRLAELGDDRRLLGAWAHEAQVAAENVPELRKLIQAEPPQMAAE